VDPNTAVVIVAIVGVLVPLTTAFLAFIQQRSAAKAVATKVEAVRTDLKEQGIADNRKMDEIAKVGVDTHTLVNSNMGIQLRLAASFARRVADLTKNVLDISAAEIAEAAYKEHVAKQAIVDSGVNQPKV